MTNPIKKLLILATVALTSATCAQTWAQTQDSPYSMLGYGVLNDHVSASQRQMGGVGYAMRNSRQINVMNPASYAAIDSMTFLFDIGADVSLYRATEAGGSGHKTLGGLDYITLQVPIGRRMGASAGLLPYSTVGYSFGSTVPNGETQYQGSGGITEAYVGFAGSPVKGLSLGFNISYLFGNVLNDVYVYDSGSGGTSLYETVLKVRDFNLQLGAQYGLDINRTNRLTLGLSYTLGKDFHGESYGEAYDVDNGANNTGIKDGYAKLGGRYTMPHCWGAGVAYEWNRRLFLEADFTYQPWSRAKFAGIEGYSAPLTFADRYRGAFGAQFLPRQRGNYAQRITYRLGGYYGRDYQMVMGNNVNEYGLSFGFGLPTPLRSVLNIGFEYKHRFSSPVTTVTENYFTFTLGINISENWFMPSKIR